MRSITVFIFFIIFFSTSVYSQNADSRRKEYLYANSVNLANDSLLNYIVSLKKNLKISKKEQNEESIADNSLLLSVLYYRLNSYEIAIDYLSDALKIFESRNDTTYIISSYQQMSAMSGYTGNNEISLEFSQKNLEIAKLKKDTSLIENCYINLSANHISLGNDSLGLLFYKKALKIAKENGKIRNIAFLYSNIGSYHYYKMDYDSALFYYQKSLNLIKEKNRFQIVASLYSNIAETFLKQKKYEQALKNAKISVDLFQSKDMTYDATDAYQIIINSLASLNRSKKIPYYLSKYDSIMKENVKIKKTEQTTKLKVLYDISKYESKISKLDIENKLKSSKIFYISLFLLVAFFIIVYIVIQNLKLKRTYKIIVNDNIKVIEAEDENKKLKKIISEKITIRDEADAQNSEIQLYNSIVSVIESEKLYLDSNFNLHKLSELIDTNRSYISKSINKISKKSFVEFINEYRVNEAKRMLKKNEVNTLTIQAIGEKSGFNSYSTFTRVFKTTVGITPSFFMKNAQSF